MNSLRLNQLALSCVLASLVPAGVLLAQEEGVKALPTLLIKGEVVSMDANDPTATLLKVKDRYGFETPIYLTQETKLMQGDQPTAASSLSSGAKVEVEYNFDVNTAKRHAVMVKIAAPEAATASAAAMAPAVAPAPVLAAPVAPETMTQESVAPAVAADAATTPDAPAAEPAAQ